MSTSPTPTTTTATRLDMSSSPDATDQASYSNAPQELTMAETPVPESTTAAEATSEPPLTTATETTSATTENQADPTTQVPTTTQAPITAETTQTIQEAQAYTEAPVPYKDDLPDSQPTLDIQSSMASNPTLTLTETSIASVSPTIVVVTSTSGISAVLSTSTCIPDSTETTGAVCSSSSAASQEANAAKMTVAQIAGIVVGVLGLFSLLVACILLKKRKHSKASNKRRISPFFYMNDQHPDPEKNLPFDTSKAALYQSYKNEQPYAANTATNSSASDMSESVCGDNIFYSNSTDYHRSSSIMHQQGINEKLTVITSPGKSHHAAGYASSPLKMDANTATDVNTPTTLYPHMKRSDSSDFSKQTSSYNPFSNHQQTNAPRTSTDIDTDNYTLSAMQLFQTPSNRNTATTTTTSTSRSMSPIISSFVGASRQQYRPSLHDSMYLGSQISSNNSSSDDSSTIRSLPMAQQPPPRFSRHHRQESSLDPHFYQQQQQQQQQLPHTMSLWDDHLN